MTPLPLSPNPLPQPPPLRSLFGPSFILLGLGLGSGELILWPYLASNFGLGIIWAALLGISFQFFINMEVERYTLVTGESVFVGLARKLGRLAPLWFILSTLIPWMWPGIIASSGTVLSRAVGLSEGRYLSIALLILIGSILTLGPVLYKTVEKLQKTLIALGVPFIFLLTLIIAKSTDWIALAAGVLGQGASYTWLPEGLPFATFLAAFAYAGAGGNLNLAQSFYIKEKGYGMGKYAGRITSLLTGKKEEVKLEGGAFVVNNESLPVFRRWWKLVNLEHLVVFWFCGALTILLLALLAFSTVFGQKGLSGSVSFLFVEAQSIGQLLNPALGTIFLLVVAVMLFATQLTVFDATSRIMAENVVILLGEKTSALRLPQFYYGLLWLLIVIGVLVFGLGFGEPLALLTLGAVLNALTMFVYIALLVLLNLTSLDKKLRPSAFRLLAMGIAFLFFGGFSAFVVFDRLWH